MKIQHLLILVPVFLAGCAGNRIRTVEVPIREGSVAGTEVDPQNVENLRYDDAYKAYSEGRTVDPNNPNTMHEAHTVYRRESSEAWNQNPNTPVIVPAGPDNLAVSQPVQPRVLPEDTEQKMAELKNVLAITTEQNDQMAREMEKLQDMNKNIEKLTQQYQAQQTEIERLKGEKAAAEEAAKQAAAAADTEKKKSWWEKLTGK